MVKKKNAPPSWPGAKIPVSTATAVGGSSLDNSIRTIFRSRRRPGTRPTARIIIVPTGTTTYRIRFLHASRRLCPRFNTTTTPFPLEIFLSSYRVNTARTGTRHYHLPDGMPRSCNAISFCEKSAHDPPRFSGTARSTCAIACKRLFSRRPKFSPRTCCHGSTGPPPPPPTRVVPDVYRRSTRK